MSRFALVPIAFAMTAMASPLAYAATDAELAEIREQIRQLKENYEARINALEARLKEAEANASAAKSAAASAAPAPVTDAAAPPTGTASPASGLAAFNPAISVVLQGTYANLSQDPQKYAISGFAKTDDVSPGRRGLSLGESEIGFSANVDDKFAGNLIVSLTPENTLSVEEAYGFMPSLPNGLVPKFGRFFSGIGYLNEQHQHVWDFFDAPLVYQAFLGGQFDNDGVQLKWVAPTEQFLEFGAEIGNGDAFPGSPRNHNGIGAADVYVHTGGDIGASHSWRAGLSYLETRANDRPATQLDAAGNLADVAFTGKSRIAIADFVWKYAPNGNATQTNFKLQGEYFWRRESGDLTYDANGALGLTQTGTYSASQNGGYIQGVWQFQPYWRVGVRYDRLNPGAADYGANADLLDVAGFHPERYTVMLDYTPSEFSRFRLQYAESKTRPDFTDHQWFLQYILTLGAHGAHKF
jgi:hypothetical protein